jgi:GAF domain-containing protein
VTLLNLAGDALPGGERYTQAGRLQEVGLNKPSHEDELSKVQRHVMEAEQHVADLKRIVEELLRDKHTAQAALARRVLHTLEESLALARDHVTREEEKVTRGTAGRTHYAAGKKV